VNSGKERNRLRRMLYPSLLFALSLALVLTLWWTRSGTRADLARIQFERQADAIEQSLHKRVALLENLMRAGRTVIHSRADLTHLDWRQFVHAMEWRSRYPDMTGIAWASFVPGSDRQGFESLCRSSDARFAAIHPAGDRDEYFVVRFIEPYEDAPFQLGFDLASEPRRREAAQRARDSGEATLSAPIRRAQPEVSSSADFLHFLPVYRPGAPIGSPAERRTAILGWVIAEYSGEHLVQGAVAGMTRGILFDFHDGSEVAPRSLIAANWSAKDGERPADAANLNAASYFKVGGRVWTLRLWSTDTFEDPYLGDPDLAFLVAGILLSLAAAWGMHLLLAVRSRALAIAHRMTRELRDSQARLRVLATTDDLTGTCNRRHFFERAERELERTIRFQRPLSLIMLDLDHFKNVNDRLGHAVGDEALATMGEILRSQTRGADITGRVGGEEFAILLVETGLVTAIEVAERIRSAVEMRILPGDSGPVRLTVSLGVAEFTGGTDNVAALLKRADGALYEAKRKGRNRVEPNAAG
jgi:diguanylate cyclase (GGDEF)-like protein